MIGEYISTVFGRDLYRYCHVDKEPSILVLMLKFMATVEGTCADCSGVRRCMTPRSTFGS